MGYNTVFYVLNDALPAIQEHPEEFTRGLHQAAMRTLHYVDEPLVVDRFGQWGIPGHTNVAGVIDSTHADNTIITAVGGNLGTTLGVLPGFYRHFTIKGREEAIRLFIQQQERLKALRA